MRALRLVRLVRPVVFVLGAVTLVACGDNILPRLDTAGVAVTPTAGLHTSERGGTATFTIVLSAQPDSDVAIGLMSSAPTEGTIDRASLRFTHDDWNAPQTVTVTGVNDDVADAPQPYTIVSIRATSVDARYQGLDPADVAVINDDDDTAAVFVTPTSGLTTTEAGGIATFTIVLGARPVADVTMPVASMDAT